ncbi:MAG: hypothetical protein D6733_03500 [Methanobacteriota archaeon]|nr:MAG: hypothetical protein D6733_03500 [Euryarchaeota archaeon]
MFEMRRIVARNVQEKPRISNHLRAEEKDLSHMLNSRETPKTGELPFTGAQRALPERKAAQAP